MTAQQSSFDTIEDAIIDIRAGKMVIVADDEDRENEGDLIMAACKATPETINTMIKHARGLICAPTTGEQLKRLGINQMVADNRESHGTDFSISVDASEGIASGISAFDRAKTLNLLADPSTKPEMLVQPGHIFPLRAKPGGVLQRAGHTEATVDLAILAGLPPVGVLCEILNEDGTMARMPNLIDFKERFNLKLISIADLIEYRHKRDKLVQHVVTSTFESEWGVFDLHIYKNLVDGRQHIALTKGNINSDEPVLVRVQSENILHDVFHSKKGKGYVALKVSMERVAEAGRGVILYMEQPNGGIQLQDVCGQNNQKPKRIESVSMNFRDYGIGAQILSDLGVRKLQLLSCTPRKVVGLDGYGLEIVEQISLL